MENREGQTPIRTIDKGPELKPYRAPDILDEKMRVGSIKVRETGRTGKGLFAWKPIKAGEEVFVFDGEKYAGVGNFFSAQNEPNSIGVGQDKKTGRYIWAVPPDDSPLRFLNHSCKEPKVVNKEGDPFTFVATGKIAAGEEITANYSMLEPSTAWAMPCECGEPECRHTIRGADSLPLETMVRYWHNISDVCKFSAITYSREPRIAALRDKLGAEELTKFDYKDESEDAINLRKYLRLMADEYPGVDPNLEKTMSAYVWDARCRLGAKRIIPNFLKLFSDIKQQNSNI